MAETTEGDYDGPAPVPTYESGTWEASIELRLKRLTLIAYADGAIAIGAIALSFLAFKGLANLAKGLSNIGQLAEATSQAVFGNPNVPTVPAKQPKGTDETIVGTDEYVAQGNPVAEPFDRGPAEVSDDVRALIEEDPISPADLGKGPEFN
jgi:hypothetical protein